MLDIKGTLKERRRNHQRKLTVHERDPDESGK